MFRGGRYDFNREIERCDKQYKFEEFCQVEDVIITKKLEGVLNSQITFQSSEG